jgi:hypothetical protein
MKRKKIKGRKLGCVICNSIMLVVKHINRSRNEDAVNHCGNAGAEDGCGR